MKSFHFQAAWISHPDYTDLVKNTWLHSHGTVNRKLDKIQAESITFNERVFGNIFRRKRQLVARIKGVHRQLDNYPCSSLITLERDLQEQHNRVLQQEELLWYQKSREKWVKHGNKNTKKFHTQTVIRRRRNKVTGLMIDSVWCTNEETLKREALSFFKNLFQSNDQCNPNSLKLDFVPRIDQSMHDALLRSVSMVDVKEAIFSMSSYKAPGIDGFQPIFFKTYWNVVAMDVWEMVSSAFATGYFDPSLAATMILPIPKVDTPNSFKDFRPISLCNVLFKCISKVLVNRIRPHLDKIISPLQSSFIPKRGTSDNAMITQEIVHHMHKKKGKKG